MNIVFEKTYDDESLIDLTIKVNTGDDFFTIRVYTSEEEIKKIYEELNQFKDQIHGGIYDLELGSFGPEYAGGAFLARMHFQARGKINITTKMQSSYFHFGKNEVAKEAILHLISEPALLDNFIIEFKHLGNESGKKAELECIHF
ncbi:MAG: hypothetical protein SFU98_06830 [Leptospiraceae bacterium]|nr:hypothetical protein [Leptospiraceae bacterium]